jgi:S-formylglutathione hydrolase FrmB
VKKIRARSNWIAVCLLASTWAWAQGRVDCTGFHSRILGREVRYCVLLPPGYQVEGRRKYPVLYFLHGLGENEQALVESGGWELIEGLRQAGKIGDFLVVAPQGWSSFFINSADGRDRYSDFFLAEFLPRIEAHYRVIAGRSARGITGLSMGGYGALRFAFAHPELFGSVSAQSPALITESPRQMSVDLTGMGSVGRLLAGAFGNPIDVAHWNQNSPLELARLRRAQIRGQLIYINCGEQDEYGFSRGAAELDRVLERNHLPHEFHLYPGGHNAGYFLAHLGETMEFHGQAFARRMGSVR